MAYGIRNNYKPEYKQITSSPIFSVLITASFAISPAPLKKRTEVPVRAMHVHVLRDLMDLYVKEI